MFSGVNLLQILFIGKISSFCCLTFACYELGMLYGMLLLLNQQKIIFFEKKLFERPNFYCSLLLRSPCLLVYLQSNYHIHLHSSLCRWSIYFLYVLKYKDKHMLCIYCITSQEIKFYINSVGNFTANIKYTHFT